MQIFLKSPLFEADENILLKISTETGEASPSIIEKQDLISGIYITIPDDSIYVRITSNGTIKKSVVVKVPDDCLDV
jgi:hypothetical protein